MIGSVIKNRIQTAFFSLSQPQTLNTVVHSASSSSTMASASLEGEASSSWRESSNIGEPRTVEGEGVEDVTGSPQFTMILAGLGRPAVAGPNSVHVSKLCEPDCRRDCRRIVGYSYE